MPYRVKNEPDNVHKGCDEVILTGENSALFPKVYSTMSEDIIGVPTVVGGCDWHLVCRGKGCFSTPHMHRTASHNKSVNVTETGNPWT